MHGTARARLSGQWLNGSGAASPHVGVLSMSHLTRWLPLTRKVNKLSLSIHTYILYNAWAKGLNLLRYAPQFDSKHAP